MEVSQKFVLGISETVETTHSRGGWITLLAFYVVRDFTQKKQQEAVTFIADSIMM